MNMQSNITLIEIVAAELRAYMGEDFDETAFVDTLDGETDFADIIDRLLADEAENDALADGLATHIDMAQKRLSRIKARKPGYRNAIHKVMQAAGIRKLERPLGTVSITKGREYARIVHEDDVPSQLMTVKTTQAPDKKAILAALKAGETVPGCELLRGDDSVTVRRL
jgi:hypothetical protein